jgi:triosephosphate isomerase
MYLIANFKAHQVNISDYTAQLTPYSDTSLKIILSPPFPYLTAATMSPFSICSQDVSAFDDGPFTGEVTAKMLRSISVDFCLVGHSERRIYFHENGSLLTKKIGMCLENEIQPIICVGETREEHLEGNYLKVIETQIEDIFIPSSFSPIIAYEPVWAIGSGQTPDPSTIRAVIDTIKNKLPESKVLYGGSVQSQNARMLSAHTDGLLVGSASVDVKKFIQIIQQLETL